MVWLLGSARSWLPALESGLSSLWQGSNKNQNGPNQFLTRFGSGSQTSKPVKPKLKPLLIPSQTTLPSLPLSHCNYHKWSPMNVKTIVYRQTNIQIYYLTHNYSHYFHPLTTWASIGNACEKHYLQRVSIDEMVWETPPSELI